MKSGFATCDVYCASVGETCVENGCGGLDATARGFETTMNCEKGVGPASLFEPCSTIQSWGAARPVVQCCCSDTK